MGTPNRSKSSILLYFCIELIMDRVVGVFHLFKNTDSVSDLVVTDLQEDYLYLKIILDHCA